MVQLQVFFFPVMAHGHMIPILDMARLFASRGVHSTIITTPLNAPAFAKGVQRSNDLGFQMTVKLLQFPKVDGLPEDCENADQLTSPAMFPIFFGATKLLKDQLEQLLEEYRPNCLVADLFFPWATDSAAKFDIPRLVFHGSSFFASCAGEQVRLHRPFKNLKNDSDEFFVPNFPHKIKLCLSQIPPHVRTEEETEFAKTLTEARESESRSHGVIVNSFYELEPEYVDHYRNVLNRRAWHIGPLSLCNRSLEEKAQRGKQAAISEDDCLKWLDSKSPNSVLYVCFGSISKIPTEQLHEIAMGLEASGQQFIWVVRKGTNDKETEDWMPEGFEERMIGKGLIIRGWAPQVMILDHGAVGGFVTHCGWNSTLEGIAAGVPMVTWPSFAEQFYNEKLITDVLRIGVSVGAKEWVAGTGGGNIKRDAVETAVRSIIVGEEAKERRNRCKGLKEMAKKAVEEGGSSYSDLNALIQELSLHPSSN
ncbi:Glycosyltransferase [Heracleum sosnowskyi]|uniref:Glycosyltransferase n=1 Tax=Heracleum sosnowskyi TaxID=360622 RepID=A0AAD8H393_9APIA|nr:Glycosyltransferase [Heracleum sosnowskyi]